MKSSFCNPCNLWLSLFLLLFGSNHCFTQINDPIIKNKLTEKSYYKLLIEKFNNSDSTLSLEDFNVIYYGYYFNQSFNPIGTDSVVKEVKSLNFNAAFIEAYELADSLLKINPTSISAYFEKAYACHSLKRFSEEDYCNRRYKVLLNTVISDKSGVGYSNAFHVIQSSDIDEVLAYLQLSAKGFRSEVYEENYYEVISLDKNKAKLKEIYFRLPLIYKK